MPHQNLNLNFLFVILLFVLSSCSKGRDKCQETNELTKRELIIYCENAMVSPILAMKDEFEKKYDCKIQIHNDCEQNLIGNINQSKKGDLYIPASNVSFSTFSNKTGVELTDSMFIGFNKLVFMVRKGNPTGFDGCFSGLLNGQKSLIIANPETSSLGRITKKVLIDNGVYDQVMNNIISLTPDSKGLVKSLENDKAEVIVNWESSFYENDNDKAVDAFALYSAKSESFPVYAATLSCSKNSDLAKEFLKYSDSKNAEIALRKYGFSKRETIIF